MSDTGSPQGTKTVPKKLILPGQEEHQEPEPEVKASWDKPAPTAPPGEVSRGLPEWTAPVTDFFTQLISDEALVIDLCLEKAIEIVEWNYQKGIVGNEHFAEKGGSGATRPIVCGIAGPLALELYKQVLAGVNGPKRDDFEAAVAEMFKRKAAAECPVEST